MPVIDAFTVMLAHAEMLVRLRRKTGLGVSRTGAYARPRSGSVEQLRVAAAGVLSG